MSTENATNLALSHPAKVASIPEEPEGGFHSLPEGMTRRFADAGMFTKLGRCNGQHPDCYNQEWGCKARLWTLTSLGEKLIEMVEEPDTLPCGHTGIRTITVGEEYSCTNDNCDHVFSRKEAEKVQL